jgi:hypothetical protein
MPHEIAKIFEKKKGELLCNCKPSPHPVAILLGGQPASGKSRLTTVAEKAHENHSFLKVNGDEYRIYHPEHDLLIKDVSAYSEKTQPFSNVFTEKLIEEAIENKLNIIVEGTMRNPAVPQKTAAMFRDAGFRVEAYVIAAPSLFTETGIYIRYLRELQLQGFGRLSDIDSHNRAVTGLLQSVDSLYRHRSIDKLSIHTHMAGEKVKDFVLKERGWNCYLSPSEFIRESRNKQLNNKELRNNCISGLEAILKNIPGSLQQPVNRILSDLHKVNALSMQRGYSV